MLSKTGWTRELSETGGAQELGLFSIFSQVLSFFGPFRWQSSVLIRYKAAHSISRICKQSKKNATCLMSICKYSLIVT